MGFYRVLRGGSWGNAKTNNAKQLKIDVPDCSVTHRFGIKPEKSIDYGGFRVVFTKTQTQTSYNIPEKPELVNIKGGVFEMGNEQSSRCKPVHSVTINSFSIGKYEVTVGQYKAFCTATGRTMPKAPEWGWNDNHPIVNVTFQDAISYCKWLSKKYGGNWRLPTEAEWEFAARGGINSKGYNFAGGIDLEKLGWYEDNSGGQAQVVGKKIPNELGLYDMSGNVWEWCNDWYDTNYYKISPSNNPQGPASGTYKVLRGGSWFSVNPECTVTMRVYHSLNDASQYRGFRVVLSQ